MLSFFRTYYSLLNEEYCKSNERIYHECYCCYDHRFADHLGDSATRPVSGRRVESDSDRLQGAVCGCYCRIRVFPDRKDIRQIASKALRTTSP